MYWYYNTNLRSSIFFFINSGDIYFFLSIFLFVSKLFYDEVFEALLILSAISFPIHLTVASAVFWMTLFENVLKASIADCLAWSRRSLLYLLFKILLIFLQIFLAKGKNS